MEYELWNISRTKFLSVDNPNTDFIPICNFVPSFLIQEIGLSEKFSVIKTKLEKLEPKVNIWIENDTINIQADTEDAIRYELFGSDIGDKNMIDIIYMIFDSIEYLYHSFIN